LHAESRSNGDSLALATARTNVTRSVSYSKQYDPPAPALPIRLAAPAGQAGVHLVALLDTGADVTVMPFAMVQSLGLPRVATIRIAGVTGTTDASLHAARLEAAGTSRLAEVVAFGTEAILGRDVANEWVLLLNGPRRVLEVRSKRRRVRR
jgi:predicted aspartyl protease